jgi:hypothetical protein
MHSATTLSMMLCITLVWRMQYCALPPISIAVLLSVLAGVLMSGVPVPTYNTC